MNTGLERIEARVLYLLDRLLSFSVSEQDRRLRNYLCKMPHEEIIGLAAAMYGGRDGVSPVDVEKNYLDPKLFSHRELVDAVVSRRASLSAYLSSSR